MEELKFKTTLSCGGCESKVRPGLNAIEGIEKWEVDLASADKILTVKATKDVKAEVLEAIEAVGFSATEVEA